MLGGASGGNCATGIVGMAISPPRMMTSEHTDARMRRWMKVLTNMWLLRLHGRAVRDLLDARDDQLVARLQAALDHVIVAFHLAELYRPLPRDQPLRPLFGDVDEILAVDAKRGDDRHGQPGPRPPDDARLRVLLYFEVRRHVLEQALRQHGLRRRVDARRDEGNRVRR